MGRKHGSHIIEWRASDKARLANALKEIKEAKLYQRVLALQLVATGLSVSATARSLRCSRQAVYQWLERYGRHHRIADLRAAPIPGRPKQAPVLTEAHILRELECSPVALGYDARTWTVALLARHLQQRHQCQISQRALRWRIKKMGLEWKRAR
ncbi:MAG: hypothetical protein JWR69_538 [Pedosphaera sp.]|nr:hypothetical protein [Pedosphaera sp.]